MKKRHRIISFVILTVILAMTISMFTGCDTNKEISIPTVKENVYIYDQDNVIDDNVENELNQMLAELEKQTGAEFAVISIESLNGLTIESYSNEVFNTLGIGKDGEDNGVLLLFSRSDTRVRLEIGRGLEGCLNDSKCGRILDDYFVPYRDKYDYTEATRQTVNAVLIVLAEEYNINIEGMDRSVVEENDSENESDSTETAIMLIILAIVAIVMITILMSNSGGGGYSGSSGGFSGGEYSGSTRGFSGGGSFGGGFSGGGGASR